MLGVAADFTGFDQIGPMKVVRAGVGPSDVARGPALLLLLLMLVSVVKEVFALAIAAPEDTTRIHAEDDASVRVFVGRSSGIAPLESAVGGGIGIDMGSTAGDDGGECQRAIK